MLWCEANAILRDYPGRELYENIMGDQMMLLTKNPEIYGVIVVEFIYVDFIRHVFVSLVSGFKIFKRGGCQYSELKLNLMRI
jgi:isocitrate/isopropylmalate dehydrogenase